MFTEFLQLITHGFTSCRSFLKKTINDFIESLYD